VAKLIIYRGDTLDREIELGERSARIGRGDQNEIVLPDPAKSVSRFHAELRFEQGSFTIVDLNSQNGIWVAGRRVHQAILEPDVPVVLGTYRLMLRKDAPPLPPEVGDVTMLAAPRPATQPGVVAPPPVTSTSATMVGSVVPERAAVPAPVKAALPPPPPVRPPEPPKVEPPPPSVRPPEPPKVEPPPPPVRPPAPPKVEPPPPSKAMAPPPRPAPKSDPPPAPKPAPAPPAPARPTPPPAPKRSQQKGLTKGLLYGVFAVVILIVIGAAVYLTPLKDQLVGLTGGQSAESTKPTQPPSGSETATPPAEDPAPTLAAPPAVEPPATSASPAPVPQVSAAPPAGAKPPAASTPSASPRAGGAATPRGGTPAGTRRGRDTTSTPAAKPLNLAQTLEEARSAMIKGDYLAAIAGFEAILKVDPKYPNAADLLGVAKGGAQNASQLAVDAGNKAEMGGDYAAAAKDYDRAIRLDPNSTAAPDAIRRMKARMQGEGEDAFRRARQYDALGRGKDAIPMYEKAIQLLPPDHASVAVAKERLAALKGGF
jgi:hypothetical protein